MAIRLQGQLLPVINISEDPPALISLTTTSARIAIPTGSIRSIRLWSTVDCFFRFGNATVVATTSDHPLTAKLAEVYQIDTSTFLAAIVSLGTGTLYISKLEE